MAFRKLYLFALLGSASAAAFAAPAAYAQTFGTQFQVAAFDIPAGALTPALQSFSRQAGVEVIFSNGQLQGLRTKGLKGRHPPLEALNRLLKGAPVSVTRDTSGALLVKRSAAVPVGQNMVAATPAPVEPEPVTVALGGPDAVAVAEEPEIVVTAQRRAQRAVDVPISLNVFDKDTLEKRRITSVEDIAQMTPGMDAFEGNGTNNPTITLRGVGTTNPFLNNNPSVAVYSDGVYLPLSSFLSLPFFDIERVEVLKGPQVALYGRNATAGAINIISSRPTRRLSGYADVSYASYGLWEARGAVSGPVTDNLQVRLSGVRQAGGGYIDRPGTIGSTAGFTRSPSVPGVPAVPAEDGYGDKDVYALRASLAWQPLDAVDVTLTAVFGEDNSELVGSTNINGDRLRIFMPPSDEPYVDYDNVKPKTDTKQYGVVLQGEMDLGDVTLTSISGYNRIAREYAIGDFVPVRIAEANFSEKVRSLSQEFRLVYTGSDRFHGTLGASYNDDKIDYQRVLVAYDFLFGALGTDFVEKDKAWAFYGDGEWEFHPGWFAAAGLRYTIEDRKFDGGSFDINPFGVSRIRVAFPGIGPEGLFGSPDYHESDLSGRASLNWKPNSDILLYASVNRGFKSGGFDGSGVTTPAGFEPYNSEKVWAYEAGAKASLGRSIDVSGAAFYYDYTDKQVLALIDLGTGITEAVIQNAAAAQIKGIEAEIRFRPIKGLTLSLNGTLLDSKVTEFVSANPAETAARVGNELPGTPKKQFTAAIDYSVPLTSKLTLATSMWANHVKGAYRDIANTEALRSEQRTLVNGRVTLSNEPAGWSLYAFAENIFDERYVNSVRSLVGMLGNYYGAPRSVGVGARYQF